MFLYHFLQIFNEMKQENISNSRHKMMTADVKYTVQKYETTYCLQCQ